MPYRVLRRLVLNGTQYQRDDKISERTLNRMVGGRHKSALIAAGYIELVEAEPAAEEAAPEKPVRVRRRRQHMAAEGGEG